MFDDIEAAEQALLDSRIGGGSAVSPRYTESDADVIVSETSEFRRADDNDIVYIADGETVQVSSEPFDISGTKLIGGRHKDGVEPGTVDVRTGGPDSAAYRGAIRANSGGSWHAEGFKIRGPLWDSSKESDYYNNLLEQNPVSEWPGFGEINKDKMNRSERDAFRKRYLSRGINAYVSGSARNLDIGGFLHAGISIGAKSYKPDVTVKNSALHNCATPGYGYGVNHFNGELLSEQNFYDANRRSITGFGWKDCEYTTREDLFGPNQLLAPVDMHNLAENKQTGLDAGKRLDCERCTFVTATRVDTPTWYSGGKSPGMKVRGHPHSGAPGYTTRDCEFAHSKESDALSQVNVSFPTGWKRSGNSYSELHDEKGVPIDWEAEPEPVVIDDGEGAAQRRARAKSTSQNLGRVEEALQ